MTIPPRDPAGPARRSDWLFSPKIWSSPNNWLSAKMLSSALLPSMMVASLLASCGGSPSTVSTSDSEEESSGNQLVYENLNLTETNEAGDLLWELNASTAEYGAQGQAAQLFDVSGVIYDGQGNQILLEAETGLVLPGGERMELEENFVAEVPHLNLKLVAERAAWITNSNILTAVGNVVITELDKQVVLEGDRITADLAKNFISLRNDTDDPLQARSVDPPIDMLMSELDWDLSEKLVMARGNVDVYHSEQSIRLQGNLMTLEIPTDLLTISEQVYAFSETDGAQLWADRAEWILGSDITDAFGNVRYEQPEQDLSVAGPKGQANWATNTFTVLGRSTLTQFTLPDNE